MILDDMIKCANRYRWLRKEIAAGRETYIGEYIPNEEWLDKYIDGKMEKEHELQ